MISLIDWRLFLRIANQLFFYPNNKNPGSEYLSKKSCNDIRTMLTKTIFKDDLKQIYDEKQSLRDKIIDEVEEKVNNFQMDIGGANDDFLKGFNDLKFYMTGYTGKRNYQFISREQKEKVNAVVKIVCKDENLQELYRQWCRLQLANQRYYRKNPEKSFDALEKNKNFERRLQNAVLKSALRDNRNEHVYTNNIDILPVYTIYYSAFVKCLSSQ